MGTRSTILWKVDTSTTVGTHQVYDSLEVDTDGAALQVQVMLRAVDEDGDLFGADLPRSVAKDKEHGVNDVGLATAIGTHNGGEALCVCACVCVCARARVCVCVCACG